MIDVVLDFETYFDSDYQLRKMSVSEYVRDPRFEMLCTCVQMNGEQLLFTDKEQLTQWLRSLDESQVRLIGHNLQFDGFILHEHFNFHPGQYACTLSAARAVIQNMTHSHSLDTLTKALRLGAKGDVLTEMKGLHLAELSPAQLEKLVTYCRSDVILTAHIFDKLWRGVPQMEQRLIDWTIRAFCQPALRVDIPRAQAALDETITKAQATIKASGLPLATLRSDAALARTLEALGYTPPTKRSEKQNKEVYAFAKTDDGLKSMLTDERPEIRRIAAARLAAKSTIDETRANRLVQMGSTGDGRLAVFLNYWGAHTGRWSGGNKMNMQNFRRGSELRKSIIAPPGYGIAVGDLSQIEVRIASWLAEQTEALNTFRKFDRGEGPDIYKVTAAAIYDIQPDEVTAEQRFIGKTSRLGLQYGMGWRKYRATLALGAAGAPPILIKTADAVRIVKKWRNTNPELVGYWQTCEQMLAVMAGRMKGTWEMGGVRVDGIGQSIWLPSGRWIRYWGLRQLDTNYLYLRQRKPIYTYGGKITENLVQAVARDVIAHHMLTINKRYRVVSMSHDEILALVPEEQAEEGLAWILEIMRQPPSWCSDLPLNAEGQVSKEYGK